MSPKRHLQDAANAMIAAAEQGRPVAPVLKRLCPHIHRQIVRDRRHPGLLSLWGRCVNVDENAGQVIVHPAILHAIGQVACVSMRGRVIHAGLQHTYGYLFSLIDTPYGAKRDRWVSTDLERGFGLELSLLGDRPRQGTLLANLTWFLAQIVYRGQAPVPRRLRQDVRAVAPALVDYDYTHLPLGRVEEEVTVVAGNTRRTVAIFTDLIPFPKPPADPGAESTLLSYSVQTGVRSSLKLITAFPVRPQVATELWSAASEGRARVRLRYNAYVPGLFGRTVPGRRRRVRLPG